MRPLIRKRFWIIAVLAALAMTPITFVDLSQAQTSRQIALKENFSEVLTLSRPAHTIVVGNPKIAAAVVGPVSNTIIVTGIKTGSTDLLVLDDKGQLFLQALIDVESGEAQKESGEAQRDSGEAQRLSKENTEEDVTENNIKIRYPLSNEAGGSIVRTFVCEPYCEPQESQNSSNRPADTKRVGKK